MLLLISNPAFNRRYSIVLNLLQRRKKRKKKSRKTVMMTWALVSLTKIGSQDVVLIVFYRTTK